MRYRLAFILFIIVEVSSAQYYFASKSWNLPVFPLKKVQNYSLSDTLNMLSEEVYKYDQNKLLSKTFIVSLNADTTVKEYKYNSLNKISGINYYKLVKHIKANQYSVEFSYNDKGQLSYEEVKNIPGSDSYAFTYNALGQMIEQKIYRKSEIQKITFEYDSLGQLSRMDDLTNAIEYIYWKGLLISEVVYDKLNRHQYEVLYSYDNGLLTKVDRPNWIQKNTYNKRKLFKQKDILNRVGISDCGADSAPDPSSLKVFEYYD